MRIATPLSLLSCLWLCACFTADLDPGLAGVFACEESSDCPEGLVCANELCETADALPTIEVTNPEDRMPLAFDPADGPTRIIPVRVLGTLTLRPRNETSEHVSGEGHVVVFVDGQEAATIDSGPLSGGVTVDVQVANTPGPHRIRAVARRNDGIDYDNEEAKGTRLFWLDDGQPHVAILRPWPGTVFDLDIEPVTVEVTSIHFEIEPPQGIEKFERRGHAHIHYDDPFPICPRDANCDNGYIAIVPGPGRDNSVDTMLPESGATTASLTAVLRHMDHTPYFHPFMPDAPTEGEPLFDTIQIVRAAD